MVAEALGLTNHPEALTNHLTRFRMSVVTAHDVRVSSDWKDVKRVEKKYQEGAGS